MRSLCGLALIGFLALGHPADARAQWAGAGGATYGYRYVNPPPAQAGSAFPHAFKDEPLASVNRSYLGYSNFVDYGPNPPAPRYVTPYGRAVHPGYYDSAPARGGIRWFGRRRALRY